MNVFSGYISEGWRDFSRGIDPKPEAVFSHTFSGYCSGPLGKPRGRYEEAAKGCLELYFFESSQRAAWGASRSVGKGSRKRTSINIFPGYISEGWGNFFAKYRPKAEGRLVSMFFRDTSPDAGGAFCGGSTKSRKLSGATLFRAIAAGR